jgi:hypothetical protein
MEPVGLSVCGENDVNAQNICAGSMETHVSGDCQPICDKGSDLSVAAKPVQFQTRLSIPGRS